MRARWALWEAGSPCPRWPHRRARRGRGFHARAGEWHGQLAHQAGAFVGDVGAPGYRCARLFPPEGRPAPQPWPPGGSGCPKTRLCPGERRFDAGIVSGWPVRCRYGSSRACCASSTCSRMDSRKPRTIAGSVRKRCASAAQEASSIQHHARRATRIPGGRRMHADTARAP